MSFICHSLLDSLHPEQIINLNNFFMKLSNRYLLILAVVLSGVVYFFSCTRKDQIIDTTVKITRGSDIILPKAASGGDTTKFLMDKVHSNCMWQGNYQGAAGLLTGRFTQFGMANVTTDLMTSYATTGQPLPDTGWAFYENDPTKTYFNGYVQINTSNTGEPGRDTGCNIGTLGTIKIVPGTQNLAVQNLAKIHTTKVEFDPASNGYILTMDLTWQGKLTAPLTKSVVGKLVYVRKTRVQFGTGAAYSVFGFQLIFQFNCRDFGITSTSISDNITIEANMNFNNK
jgi:hypothetical protein